MTNEYRLVLGLEIHLHVRTPFKMFCGCGSDFYNTAPNTHTCPTCLGLPGALPVPNQEAIYKTQLLGLALDCSLNSDSRFDRKHYFYPDLPKGYQISQYKRPFCENGKLQLDSGLNADIERIHLEEDTAKSIHENGQTLIDFNKSGMPLIEIVTRPCFKSVEDAVDFSKKIQDLVIWLGVGDADMEKGQLRLEANISMRTPEMEMRNELPKYKVEVKNINSFRFMEKAVKAEMVRQTEILTNGGTVLQENRGWDEIHGITVSQREKEEAHDYRYFPEPDIPPFTFDTDYFTKLKNALPELPWERKAKLINEYSQSKQNADFLSQSSTRDLYQKYVLLVSAGLDAVSLANLFINKKDTRDMTEEELRQLLNKKEDMITDTSALEVLVSQVFEANPDVVQQIRNGKESSIEFIVGQIMKLSRGKASPSDVKTIVKSKILS